MGDIGPNAVEANGRFRPVSAAFQPQRFGINQIRLRGILGNCGRTWPFLARPQPLSAKWTHSEVWPVPGPGYNHARAEIEPEYATVAQQMSSSGQVRLALVGQIPELPPKTHDRFPALVKLVSTWPASVQSTPQSPDMFRCKAVGVDPEFATTSPERGPRRARFGRLCRASAEIAHVPCMCFQIWTHVRKQGTIARTGRPQQNRPAQRALTPLSYGMKQVMIFPKFPHSETLRSAARRPAGGHNWRNLR